MTVVFPEAPTQGGTWRCQVRGMEAPPSDKNLLQGLVPSHDCFHIPNSSTSPQLRSSFTTNLFVVLLTAKSLTKRPRLGCWCSHTKSR